MTSTCMLTTVITVTTVEAVFSLLLLRPRASSSKRTPSNTVENWVGKEQMTAGMKAMNPNPEEANTAVVTICARNFGFE